MPAFCYQIRNNAMVTTGPPTLRATAAVSGTSRTMLQLAPVRPISIIAWGYSFDAVPAASPRMELIDTDTIFATGLTAAVAADIVKWNCPGADATSLTLGTGATGFYTTGSAPTEGSITTTRLLDHHYENGLYLKYEYTLGREAVVLGGKAVRVRATPTSSVAVNLDCWVRYEEG